MSVLICVQTVCKGYQQMIKVTASKERSKDGWFCSAYMVKVCHVIVALYSVFDCSIVQCLYLQYCAVSLLAVLCSVFDCSIVQCLYLQYCAVSLIEALYSVFDCSIVQCL